MTLANRIVILYGSQTYTAQEYAERIWRTTKLLDLKGPVQAMDDYPVSRLIHEEYALFVCSTTGEGDEPDNMKTFWKFLLRKNLPAKSLTNLKFGVIGLGDSSYSKFNFAAKKLHKRLLQLGAQALHEIALCDYQHDLGHDAVMIPWLKTFLGKIKPDISAPDIGALKFVPRWKVSLTNTDVAIKENGITKDIYFGTSNTDHFVNPLHLEIESNKRITHESHFQDVRLTVFKSVTHDNINYNPGDVFNIRPRNSKDDIADLFNILASHGIDIKPHYMLHVAECHEEPPCILPVIFCIALAQKSTLKEIHHKFLVPGHTHLECDGDHALIERFVKEYNPNIAVPQDWVNDIKMTSKNFSVKFMTQTEFYGFSKLLTKNFVKKNIDTSKQSFAWNSIFWLKFEKKSEEVSFKYSLEKSEPFRTFSMKRRGRQSSCLETLRPEQAYVGGLAIETKKFKDLMDLMQFIDPVYRNFYSNLNQSASVLENYSDSEEDYD